MEVTAEAKRIMVVALGKLYSSRTQRGGLRLHRSLLLTMVMKSARDMYHAAQETEWAAAEEQQPPTEEPTGAQIELQEGKPLTSPGNEVENSPTMLRRDADNKENMSPPRPTQHSRKRRGKAAVEPDFLPCKKAKLEQKNVPQQLILSTVLLCEYMNCSSEVGAPPAPMPVQRAIAAC
ncbi:hypothetical protein PBY51_008044 [Eleginops maclovinus]|nr:hypothetical protein PBY51_008044 [Eleginops maclovinus]